MAGNIRPALLFHAGLLLILWIPNITLSSKNEIKTQLRFNKDGYFKILQLADLHYGHSDSLDEHTDKVENCHTLRLIVPNLIMNYYLKSHHQLQFKMFLFCKKLPLAYHQLLGVLVLQVVASLLAYEKPDLVVLSGDMVSGFVWDGKPGWFETR
jgi:predicted MPP superfamily phosphohydrolase